MIRSALATLSICTALQAAEPADLKAALDRAEQAWGVHAEATIRYASIGPCDEAQHSTVALSEPVTEYVIYQDEAGREVRREVLNTHWTISINSLCQWTPAYLEKVVTHEYGHVLGLEHSKDKADIMFWIVWRDRAQGITERDRSGARAKSEMVAAK